MKILLADPPARERAYDSSYANLGLLYLAGFLKKAIGENQVQIEYLGPKHTLKTHLEYVNHYRPKVYGISFTSKTAGLAYDTIKAVKELCPETWVVCGGTHPTALPEDVISESQADICVIGEGEVTFSELVRTIEENEHPDLSNIDGILYRCNGEVVKTNSRAFIRNLDEIPFPAWELIDFLEYEGMHLKIQPMESSLLISRGCPYDCTFCSNPIWKSAKPWLRHRSVANICEEIELLYNRGVREIYMSSDELNFDENWAMELCQGIISLKHRDLYFQCNMRADKVSERLAKLLGEMNCWLVHLGIESANDRVLKGIGKHITVKQVEDATRTLSQAGVKVFAFMMLYQVWEEEKKLCYETTEEVENSIQFMKRLFKQRFIRYMSWQFCTPMPGSRLYDIAKRYNLFRGDPRKVWESFDEHDVAMNIPGISEKSMRWKIKKGIILKDWFMVRSGNINIRQMGRLWENLRALIR
jgi:anaerobic magnesium-protoporphyrin IX monomethyl ester cyclase